jgi:sensor histidine kinase regulating citrate/malate metabolism
MTENLNDCFDTRYCSNDAVNAVVCQYASIAEKNGIKLTISLDVPTHSEKISDIDLCVIFGNLLENAIEACNAMEKGEKFIKLISNHHLSKLIITMDNSFNGVFIKKNGVIISSKDDSVGLGVSSVETLAKGHGGSSHFEPDKHSDIFHSSVYFEI